MDALERLKLLSTDSRYDLSCACGESENPKDHRRRKLDGSWLYPVSLPNGGHGTVLKTLVSNACTSDCAYCPLRHNGSSGPRCSLEPEEIVRLFYDQKRRTPLMGLFLSSGITGTADQAMQRLMDTATLLRKKHGYRGYIHLKILPGASEGAIEEAIRLSTTVSINIEVPGARHFKSLSSYKRYEEDILRPIRYIAAHTGKGTEHRRVKWTTQFIVGAATETDAEIIRTMGALYDRMHLHRLFFSAYQPPETGVFRLDDGTQNIRADREHRLYQSDWLVRKYGFSAQELLCNPDGFLDRTRDPKRVWADAHPEYYPVRLNTAPREALLRVPGIGPVAANAILKLRAIHPLRDWSEVPIVPALAARAHRFAVFS